ncbi:MAG: non-canonical purine NTP pyrophosphatase [Nannocystaceae bacterium]
MKLDATIIASTNPGKIGEYLRLLGGEDRWGQVTSLLDEGEEGPQETGATYLANATLKARYACERLDRPAIGDDSGLAIATLGGEPGLRTARFTRAHGGPTQAMRVLAERAGLCRPSSVTTGNDGRQPLPTVDATAHCVIALALPDGRIFTGSSALSGTVRWPPSPRGGPGLFPLFHAPNGWESEAAVLLHRAQAFASLLDALEKTTNAPRST